VSHPARRNPARRNPARRKANDDSWQKKTSQSQAETQLSSRQAD
jgi:hypothetical protein